MEIGRNFLKLIARIQRNKLFVVLLSFVAIIGNFKVISAAQIDVYCNQELGEVNKKVFGNNFIGYDPMTYENWAKEFYGYSDYGAGIWDPRSKQSVKGVISLAKEAGVTIARFPGGGGTHNYDWKKSIGKDRKYFLYGLDEFLKTCEDIGAEPVITVSYFTGDEKDAAELVEYLNAPADESHPWAKRRAENGHVEPYHVKYFEVGNEVWDGDDRKITKVFPQDYARRYLKYYKKMKAVDPVIRVGVVLYIDEWNNRVMEIIKDKADFGIAHIYPHPDVSEDKIKEMDPGDIFRETLGSALLKEETQLSSTLKTLREKTSKDIPLAITEYNGGFWDNDPLPYRHCLGTALLNAELLRVFMKPGRSILMANYWDFVNEYWGMVANNFEDKYADLFKSYYKRPNFYIFKLYHEHFGNILIHSKTECSTYKSGANYIPYLSVNASKSKDGKTIYLMVINKNMKDRVGVNVRLFDYSSIKEVKAWILNGPKIDALNEENHENVKIKHIDCKLNNNDDFYFTFEPHSLTAIEIESGS